MTPPHRVKSAATVQREANAEATQISRDAAYDLRATDVKLSLMEARRLSSIKTDRLRELRIAKEAAEAKAKLPE